jgi:hypothetical protein
MMKLPKYLYSIDGHEALLMHQNTAGAFTQSLPPDFRPLSPPRLS